MIELHPVTLERDQIRLEPLHVEHRDGLVQAASDGELWKLWFTSVPKPEDTHAYIETALAGQKAGHMLPWAVRDLRTDEIVGSTRYHDVIPGADRVEIGYTWYARSAQRTHVNTTCKLLLLAHAFDTVGCKVVGLRTDNFNSASQRAIEALGAKKDGVLRHHHPRPDGSVRDSVIYSILLGEWPDVRRHLEARLLRGLSRANAVEGPPREAPMPMPEENEVRLRPTLESDLDFVLELENDDANRSFIGHWSREEHRAAIVAADRQHWIVELLPERRRVGYAIGLDLRAAGLGAHLKRIVIADKGRGIGRTAVTRFVEQAVAAMQPEFVWLDVWRPNERAQAAYRAAGFQVRELSDTERAVWAAAVGGIDRESLVMVRALPKR